MKNFKLLSSIFFTFVTASAFAFGPSPQEVSRLAKVLNGHTISCKPMQLSKPSDEAYKGDEGFFKIRIIQDDLEIFDNGGSGFGFANGNVRDLHVGDEDMFLSVGDDGYENLTLHIADFGNNKPNCADGRLISYFDGFHSGGDKQDALNCCLE